MSGSEEDKRKQLALAMVEYLDKAVAENLVSSDGAESLEIAKQCISDAFEIDIDSQDIVNKLSIKPFTLDKVFDIYLNTQAKLSSNETAAAAAATAAATASGPSEKDKERADELKAEGNRLILAKDYAGAIDAYTKAIDLAKDNALYYGNRAAAFSQNGEHQKAVDDAKHAVEIDPSYSKGYSRMGLAYFGLEKYQDAVDAYEKGLALDPENKMMKSALETARSKVDAAPVSDNERSAASVSSGSGPGSGGGGFDLSSLMSNPALMGMARNMMANGGLEQLMSNPAISQMADNYRSTGQMPNMSEMMNNPELMNVARGFTGNGGDGSSGGSGSGSGSGNTGGDSGANPMASLLNNPDLANIAQQFMRGNQGGNDNNNNSNN